MRNLLALLYVSTHRFDNLECSLEIANPFRRQTKRWGYTQRFITKLYYAILEVNVRFAHFISVI